MTKVRMEPGAAADLPFLGSKTAEPMLRANETFTTSYSWRATGPGIFWPAGTSQTSTRSLSIIGFRSAAEAAVARSAAKHEIQAARALMASIIVHHTDSSEAAWKPGALNRQ